MLLWRATCILAAVVWACAPLACRRATASGTRSDGGAAHLGAASSNPAGLEIGVPPKDGARIGARNRYVVINDRPSEAGTKIGYFRLGGILERGVEALSQAGCKGGWYEVKPRGFVCAGDDATINIEDPVVKAAERQPDLTRPMPYAYGFVRAVLPLYLKVPSSKEQLAAEFKLEEHLAWWQKEGERLNKPTVLGASDVFIDALGVPQDGQHVKRLSTEMGQGELFGGVGEDDPIPWWLQGSRKIPNVSGFQVPDYAIFADRARRHTGLSFVGSFRAGSESFERRFAVTADLRLAPTTKVKPDSGSTFHGVALEGNLTLPFAWTLEQETKRFKIENDGVRAYKKSIAARTVVKLTGNKKLLDERLYYQTDDGKWIRAKSLNVARPPEPMPAAAKNGEKWIDISIEQQTLVLWEGTTPVYATLVSAGQDGLRDPKTTKSTVRGTFRLRSKHVTTVMDSNENLSAKKERDAQYGVTKRRGEGSFILQDVPWVQYFKDGYALHGAYWHDVFGFARSHGCVNLSPIDAHRVFFWTTPSLPRGWHGVYAKGGDEDGTVVYVHE